MKIKLRSALIITIFLFGVCFFMFAFKTKNEVKNLYENAIELMESNDCEGVESAIEIFHKIGNYKESVKYLETAENVLNSYKLALSLMQDKNYVSAIEELKRLGDFADSENQLKEAQYNYAMQMYESGEYNLAYRLFNELGDYSESRVYAEKALIPSMEEKRAQVYQKAQEYFKEKRYNEALEAFEEIAEYEDSQEWIKKCQDILERKRLANTISAGARFSLAINKEGKVYSTNYELKDHENVKEWRDILSIASLDDVVIGLKKDGTVETAGKIDGSEIDIHDWSDIIQISAGGAYVVGLKSDGKVVSEGHDAGDGQRKVDSWDNIVAIATGWRHTVGLKENGEILITGYGSKTQLQQIEENKNKWQNIVSIAAGGGCKGDIGGGHTVGLRSDGTVVAVGDNSYGQCNVEKWRDIKAIAAGDWHTVGLCSNGEVVATGNDGKENFDKYKNACAVNDWKHVVAIAAGSGHTIGLLSDNSIESVGYDNDEKRTNMSGWDDIAIYSEWNQVLNE